MDWNRNCDRFFFNILQVFRSFPLKNLTIFVTGISDVFTKRYS